MLIFSKPNDKISKCFYDHEENVAKCYESFEKFFEVLFSKDADKNTIESAKVAIDNYEAGADREIRHVVDVMSEAFLPVTRKNLISIVQSTDEIANLCQDIARQIVLEKIDIPEILRQDVMTIIAITKGQLAIMFTAIDKLLNNYKDISKNRKILDDVRREESHVDNIEAMLHARIFELDLSLCEKIYYKDLLEKICDISDTIEDVVDQVQVMLVEREA